MDSLGLYSCLLLLVVPGYSGVSADEGSLTLKWPVKYTFEAEKISLTAGWVEDVKYWRTKSRSRIDYYNGEVKNLNMSPRLKSRFKFGVKYEVHPETTKWNENFYVCTRTNGTVRSFITTEDILPSEKIFDHVGSEVIDENTVEKFVFTEISDADVTKTLWAILKENKTWIPIRTEEIRYDIWLGSKSKHEIWKFHDFDTDFDSTDVFNFEDLYDCQDAKSKDDELSKFRKDNIRPEKKHHLEKAFNSFKTRYNKMYADKEEHSLRMNIFQKNLKLVTENNSNNTGYKLAINKFADRTPKEMKKYKGLIRTSQRESGTHPFPYTASEVKKLASNLPSEFDLRDQGLVTPVKEQEDCGSCWTFGTTSAVEGALARKNGGRLLRLSNQALVDCAWGFGSSGCNGGYDVAAYHWMMVYGLPTEEEYGPYANKNGLCHISNVTVTYPIRGFTNVTPYSVDALKVALVNHGPLSISIHASDAVQMYQGGILYDVNCDAGKLDHEVTLVGYGQRDGEEFWIVKNSWGQTWGVDGYIHISMRDNNCGVTNEPTYPVF